MMNKRPIRAVFILLGAMLFCVILFRFGPKILLKREETSLDQTNKAFIVSGDVRIKKAKDGTGWQKLESSTVLEKGDMVKTAAGSTVDISIGKNTDKAVKIAEKSTVGFEGINPTSLNFSEGKILVALKKLEPKSSFVVKTPTAICGARGTGWLEEAGPEKTRVCVFDSQVFMNKLDANGRPERGKHIAGEGTQAVISKDGPISESQTIGEGDLQDWRYWRKNIEFLRDGKMLVNDFDRKENFNNLGAPFGSWIVFYSDPNQYCKDEFTDFERVGDKGCGLKLTYDVDTPFSAYNGFFTNLAGIDVSDYKYLIFSIKGDKIAGFTTRVNVELKNNRQTGRAVVDGITDEWKKVALPLSRFAGINSFKDMKEFVLVFSDINVTKKEGVLYIDDIYFAKDENG